MNVKYGIRNMECRRCVSESVRWHWWRYQPLWTSTPLCKERSNCCCRVLRLIIVVDFAIDFYCQLVFLWNTTIDFSCRLLLLIFAVDFCAVKFYCRQLEWRDVMVPSEWRLLMRLEVVRYGFMLNDILDPSSVWYMYALPNWHVTITWCNKERLMTSMAWTRALLP